MRIYMASMGLGILRKYHRRFPEEKMHVLRSFGARDKTDHNFRETDRDKCASLILDSGTFSLFNRKSPAPRPITLQAYISYLKRHGAAYDWYFNFDTCFIDEYPDQCFEQNVDNQFQIENLGLHPVPVIHDIYGPEVDLYIERGYEMIAVGSPQLEDWTCLCVLMDRFKGREVKIHLFATSRWEYLTDFPIFSCDTTTWAMAGGYGFLRFWNEHKKGANKVDNVYLQDYLNTEKPRELCYSHHPQKREIDEYLDRTFGLTYEDLIGQDGFYNRMVANTHFFVRYQQKVNAVQRKKGFFTAE